MRKTPKQIRTGLINNTKTNSKRKKGVLAYALDITQDIGDNYWRENKLNEKERYQLSLNWAKNRKEYSRWWLSLIYNRDIANRLATPSEIKKTKNGQLKPNKEEERLDTQARALYQAEQLIAKELHRI